MLLQPTIGQMKSLNKELVYPDFPYISTNISFFFFEDSNLCHAGILDLDATAP